MALRWRIRHKLLLGLAAVVAINALLLTGALHGLAAFTATVKTADSKLAELNTAEELYHLVDLLKQPANAGLAPDDAAEEVRAQLAKVHSYLNDYEQRLNESTEKGRSFDSSDHAQGLVNSLRHHLTAYDTALTDYVRRPRVVSDGESDKLADDPEVRKSAQWIGRAANELRTASYQDFWSGLAQAKNDQRRSVATVLATSAAGLCLMVGMLRFFYTWVFHPVRDLQQGVDRITRGDFSHRIALNCTDELQDLAVAFNEMSARLHGTYRDLTDEVNARGQQLVRSERLASLGILAAGVAHEINNPLASIAFCAEGIERRLYELLSRFPGERDTVTKYLHMIQQEAFRCKQITGSLLEFSRVGEGERRPTDLSEVVQSVLDMVQHLQSAQGKRVVFRPAGRPVALANPQELKQVVLNIVVNAFDHMDDGGVLTITLAPNGGSTELVFADTGCGMPADVLDNIFEPFFTRSRTGKGTGLGLSISHRIVSQHGGDIEASSPGPGLGSTFVVRLPLPPAVKEVAFGHAAAA